MGDKPSYEQLEQYLKRLENTVFKKIRAEAINKALFHIASAHNASETLQDFYRSIHRHLSALMDMTNFYIAISIERKRSEKELRQARKRLIRSEKLEAIGTLAALAESEGIECQLTIDDLPPVMEADEKQLKEAVKNIVVNAAEAMDLGKKVKVFAGGHPEKPGMVLIGVQDQGRGIEAQNIEKVFEPYYSSKPMGKNKGTGLGMSIAWSIVKNHQGTILIDSTPGRWTRVDILLPVFQKSPSREKNRSVPLPEKKIVRSRVKESPLVLFMDDDPMIRHITEKILVRLGYTPVLAQNGEEAVEKYESLVSSGKTIAVVILDLEVKQGMGGIEAMALLTALNPKIKAIVASGYSKDSAMENCKAFGFADSLAKPISVLNLKEALEKLL